MKNKSQHFIDFHIFHKYSVGVFLRFFIFLSLTLTQFQVGVAYAGNEPTLEPTAVPINEPVVTPTAIPTFEPTITQTESPNPENTQGFPSETTIQIPVDSTLPPTIEPTVQQPTETTSPTSVTTETSILLAPVLSLPVSNQQINNLRPAFSWKSSKSTDLYHLQISTDTGFSFLVDEYSGIDLFYSPAMSLMEGQYYWRVQAINSHLDSDSWPWSNARSFIIDITPPQAPVLTFPMEADYVATIPNFGWEASEGAVAYQFQMDDLIDFSDPIISTPDGSVNGQPSLTVLEFEPSEMASEVEFFWHVRAQDNASNWSEWSIPRSIVLQGFKPDEKLAEAASILSPPNLILPDDGYPTKQNPPTFSWNPVTDAATYQIQIDDLYTFISPELDILDTGGAVSYTPSTAISPDGTYYWRVRAFSDNAEPGDWSLTRALHLDTTGPISPALLFPANKVPNFRSLVPTFSWSVSESSASYQFQIASNVDFSPIDFTTPGDTVAGIPLTETNYHYILPMNNEIYYWRVRSCDSLGNWGLWSTPNELSVLPMVPEAPYLYWPLYKFEDYETTPTFWWFEVEDGYHYRIQISRKNTFSNPVVDVQSGFPTSSFTLTTPLVDGLYFWRVQAKNEINESGPWSEVGSFIIDTISPSIPLLSLPADKATPPSIPSFSWTLDSSATASQFEIDDEEDFSSPLITTPGYMTPGTPLKVNTFTPSGLILGQTYYWHVRVRDNAYNWTDWSETRSLTVTIKPPVGPLVAPALVKPLAGNITKYLPTLVWNSVAGGDSYQVQIANSTSFSNVFQDRIKAGSVLIHTVETPINDGVWFWRVRAINSTGAFGPWSQVRSFTYDSNPPAAPVLLLPQNGDTPLGIPKFTWSAVTSANAYQFQMDESFVFDSPSFTTPGDSIQGIPLAVPYYKPSEMMRDHSYYWRVRARDAAGNWSDWSENRKVKVVNSVPGTPVLANPTNGLFTNVLPILTWNRVAGGNSSTYYYQIQISSSSSFTTLVEDKTKSLGVLSHTITAPFSEGLWYWRVRAWNSLNNGAAGSWSQVRTFTYDITPPPAPILSLPVNEATSVGISNFTWSAAAGANAYQYQIDDNEEFSSPLITTPGDTIPGTSLVVSSYKPTGLTPGTLYFWHVRSKDAAGNWGAWSDTRTLTVQQSLPKSPVLVSPANGYKTNLLPVLTWNSVPGGITYQVQIANSAVFNPIYEDIQKPEGVLTHTPETLLTSGIWYWRVRGWNSTGGTGKWSQVRTISYETTPPAAPVLSFPDDEATPVGIPTFTWAAVAGANAYQYQIDDNEDFSSPLVTTPGDGISGTPLSVRSFKPVGLILSTPYYWHVRARNVFGLWGAWSDSRILNMQSSLPVSPVLVNPQSKALSKSLPTLTWNSVANGTAYQVQIASSSTFETILEDLIKPDGVLSHTVVTELPDGTWFWRVRAWNSTGGAGPWSNYRTIILDASPPAAPNLLQPLDSPANLRIIPVFSWSSSAGANAYQFQIDDNEDFSSPHVSTPGDSIPGTPLTGESYKPSGLEILTDYYWHVRARDIAGNWGSWSVSRIIRILPAIPAAPVLSTPPINFLTANSSPVFMWNSVANGNNYRIQIDNVSSFTSPNVDEILAAGVSTYTPALPISPDGIYYWRVQAINLNSEVGVWSTGRTFTIDTTPPPAPSLSLPINEDTPVGIPNFAWATVSGANGYQYQIDDNNDFSSPLITTPGDTFPGTTLTVTVYKPAGLVAGTVYYWHVRSRDAAGNWGGWSDTNNLKIQVSIPKTPLLTSPGSGYVTNALPVLAWSSVAFGNVYQIQISNSATFSNLAQESTIPEGVLSHIVEVPLVDGTWYWRVRALNISGGASAWSLVRTFILDTTPPTAPVLIKPDIGDSFVKIPVFTWKTGIGANAYQFQIDDNNDFASPLMTSPGDAIPGIPLTVTSYTPVGLEVNTTYYWHVRSRDIAGNWGLWSESRSMTLQRTLPVAPLLSGPFNSYLTNILPVMSWNSVPDCIKYQVQVSNSLAFSVVSEDRMKSNGELSHIVETAIPDGTWYWRIRAINATGGAGPWSDVRSFIFDSTGPMAPILYYPLNESSSIWYPPFSWSAPVGARAYQIQFDDDSNYSSPLLTTPGEGVPGTPLIRPQYELLFMEEMTPYFWHVRARDAAGNWGNWSDSRRYMNLPFVPDTPVLTAPVNGEIINNSIPTFTWEASENGFSYRIQLGFGEIPLFDEVCDPGVLSFTPPIPLTINGERSWNWRVRAINANNKEGAWSEWKTFFIDSFPPGVPSLSSPADGFISNAIPTFSWSNVVDGVNFQFQIDDNADYSSPLITTPGESIPGTPLTAMSYNPDDLPTLSPLYWHVRVQDDAGHWGGWSRSRHFIRINYESSPLAPKSLSINSIFYTDKYIFQWARNCINGCYSRIQIDTDSSFTNPTIDTTLGWNISTYTLFWAGLPNAVYYWRVQRRDTVDQEGPWSDVSRFVINPIPSNTPQSLLPVDNTTDFRDNVVFSWAAVPDVLGYQFEFSKTSDLVLPDQNFADGSLINTYDMSINANEGYFSPSTTYYWHVRSINAAGTKGEWSETRSINILTEIPSAPVVEVTKQPNNTTELSLFLKWKPSDQFNRVQIDDQPTFDSPEIDLTQTPIYQIFTYDGEFLTYEVNRSLGENKIFYWRVLSITSEGEEGNWSPSHSFMFTNYSTTFDNYDDWISNPGGTWTTNDGTFSTEGDEGIYKTSSVHFGEDPNSSFTFEARMKMDYDFNAVTNKAVPGRIVNEYGLFIHGEPTFDWYNDMENGFYFDIYQTSNKEACYRFYEYTKETITYFGNNQCTPIIHFADWNTLKIVVNEYKITFYVNNILIESLDNDSYGVGQIGFYSQRNFGVNQKTYVDWARIGPP